MQDEYEVLNTAATTVVKTDAHTAGEYAVRAYGVRLDWSATEAATAAAAGVHAAVTDTGVPQTITTAITNPPCPRNLTATPGGTDTDVKAIQVIAYGTNINDEDISETLPAFTVNSLTAVTGNKAFKTVTSIVIPAHDGTGATTSIGFGDKLGLPFTLERNTLQGAYLADTLEGTAATIAKSASALESNTIDLNSALNGTAVKAYFLLP